MVPAGNKTKCLSSVNHTTKAIHHHYSFYMGSSEQYAREKISPKKYFFSAFEKNKLRVLNANTR